MSAAAKVASSGWRYGRCGPISSVLQFEKSFDLVPGKDQAVVKMLSAPLHRTDAAVINGTALGRKRVTMSGFPRIGGCEGVGQVVSVPAAAAGATTGVKEGDTVWVAPLNGTWASHIAVPATAVHKIEPAQAGLAVNASNYIMAQQLLNGYATLKKGNVVIQTGGSSATALAVSAFSKELGITVMTASTPGERFTGAKQRQAKYGSEVFEYSAKGAREMHAKLGAEAGAALYLNAVGGRYVDTFMKLMAPKGRVVSYGAQNGFGLMFSSSDLIHKELVMDGFYLPSFLANLSYAERQTRLEFALKTLSAVGFEYPKATAATLEELPTVWDDVFVHGGRKGVVKISGK